MWPQAGWIHSSHPAASAIGAARPQWSTWAWVQTTRRTSVIANPAWARASSSSRIRPSPPMPVSKRTTPSPAATAKALPWGTPGQGSGRRSRQTPGRIRSVRGICGDRSHRRMLSDPLAGLAYAAPVPSREPLRIVQVSPHPWGSRHEVDEFVGRLSAELAGRGHRVAGRRPLGVESRGARLPGGDRQRPASGPDSLFDAGASPGCSRSAAGCRCRAARARAPPRFRWTWGGRWRACSARCEPDIVHVHEPFGPSVSATALRHSFSLNVGTFHEPQERLLSTHIARPLVDIFFGRLDVRTVTSEVTGELLQRYFPGSYELVRARAPTRRRGPTPRARFGSPTASRRSAAPCGSSCGRSAGSPPASTGGLRSGPPTAPTRHRCGSRAGCASGSR